MAERYESMLKKQQEELRRAQYEYKKAQAQFQAMLYGIQGIYSPTKGGLDDCDK